MLQAPPIDDAREVPASAPPAYTREDLHVLLTYTRNWIQYGLLAFTVFCILVGAVERLFGR